MSSEDWLAPDPDFVEDAGHGATPEYLQHLEDLAAVVRNPAGARVICWYLRELGAFDPAWSPKNAQLAKAVVLKDFGQAILDDLALADEATHDSIQRMMRIRRRTADVLLVDNHQE